MPGPDPEHFCNDFEGRFRAAQVKVPGAFQQNSKVLLRVPRARLYNTIGALDLCEGPEIHFWIALKVPKSIFESL